MPCKPGDVPNLKSPRWRCTGDPKEGADAVFFLGPEDYGERWQENSKIKVVLKRSLEQQAMRFLKPCSAEWHKRNPGSHGVTSCYNWNGLHTNLPEELVKASKAQRRPILHKIRAESILRERDHPETLRPHLRFEKVADGIFAAFLPDEETLKTILE